jgi:hypothetical protein
MNAIANQQRAFDSPATYQILVLGDLAPSWSDRLEGMSIGVVAGNGSIPVTSLVGELSDQNALAGVLITLVELHLPLISVQRLAGNVGNLN